MEVQVAGLFFYPFWISTMHLQQCLSFPGTKYAQNSKNINVSFNQPSPTRQGTVRYLQQKEKGTIYLVSDVYMLTWHAAFQFPLNLETLSMIWLRQS